MTEDQVERRVETLTNAIDRRFMTGEWTQAQYDRIMQALQRWATVALRGSSETFTIPEGA